MTLKQFLDESSGEMPAEGSVGRAGDWFDLGTIPVTTGKLCFVDPQTFEPDDGVVVKVPAGTYRVLARGIDFDGHRRVAAMRVQLEGAKPEREGEEVDEASVDRGRLVALDIGDFNARFDVAWADELSETAFDLEIDGAGATDLKIQGQTFRIALAESGFGDGGYPVFKLREGRRTVGAEVEFIADGTVFE